MMAFLALAYGVSDNIYTFFLFFLRNCFTQVFDGGGGRCGWLGIWAETIGGLVVELGVV